MVLKALDTQVGGDHYKSLRIQPVEYILANKLGWCEGNIIKYITRHKQKGERKDIEKVIHYAQMILDTEYPEDGNATTAELPDNQKTRKAH